MKATSIKIRVDRQDGSFTELESVLPHEIAEEILCDIIDWKDRWVCTPKDFEEFQTNEKVLNTKR